MFRIVKKEELNPSVVRMEIKAPLAAKKAKAGQFIILRVDEEGERSPLTVAGYDRDNGTVCVIFQIVGFRTADLVIPEKELPARAEEVEHAKEEGIHFMMLTNPIGVPGDNGAATVILAMGAGKVAAKAIDEAITEKQ